MKPKYKPNLKNVKYFIIYSIIENKNTAEQYCNDNKFELRSYL